MAPSRAQSSRQSAQGTLTVQAVVQGSVALVNVEGEWKLIVANAPDPVESHGSLQAAPQQRALAQTQETSAAHVSNRMLDKFSFRARSISGESEHNSFLIFTEHAPHRV